MRLMRQTSLHENRGAGALADDNRGAGALATEDVRGPRARRLLRMSATSLWGAAAGLWALLSTAGCFSDDNRARFYTYCDTSGCYQCDQRGCARMQGLPPGGVCRANADCAAGCYCGTGNTCQEAGFCDRQADCASGFSCDVARHSCVPGGGSTPVTPTACKSSGECATGGECFNGKCQAAPILPNHCVFNRQCGKDAVCSDGRCEAPCIDDVACGTGRACQAGRCQPRPGGGGTCVAASDCGAGQACLNGTCTVSCTKDGDCQAQSAKDVCVSGLCRPNEARVPECKINADCAKGSECVDAQCRAPCFASSDCAACSDGPVCSLGHCMTAREASPQCALSVDCGGGGVCRDGACAR